MKSHERNMKQPERQFFRYCIRRLDYNQDLVNDEYHPINNSTKPSHVLLLTSPIFPTLITEFSQKKNIPEKQLMHYKNKWVKLGFIDEETCIIQTRIILDNIPNRYMKLFPDRVLSFLNRRCGLDYWEKKGF